MVLLDRPLAVVTPTLDGDLLAVLARVEADFTTGELARLLPRFSADGIRKALARLVSQGVVLERAAGRARLYRFNHDHISADPIRALASLRQALFDRIAERLALWVVPPVFGAVFGSAARGVMRTDSDIDLLLVRPVCADPEVWHPSIYELSSVVTSWTGNDARVIEFAADEIDLWRNEPLLGDVRAHGITVAGSRAWLERELRNGGSIRRADKDR